MSSTLPARRPADLSRAFHAALVVGIHATCLAAVFTGVSAKSLVLCALLYVVRVFGVTAGYHRYFSHPASRPRAPFRPCSRSWP